MEPAQGAWWHPKTIWHSIQEYGKRMNRILGWKFLAYLVFSQLISKGALRTLVLSMMLPFFRNSVDAGTLQLYMMIVMLPWGLKPVLGLLSDLILIGGYKKRGWVLIGCAIATFSAAGLFFALHIPLGVTLLMMGIQFQISIIDLLSEAKYSEIRKETPELGSDASTLAQGLQSVGAILVMTFVGFLADAKLFYAMFIITACLVVAPIPPTLLGWLPEIRVLEASFFQLIDREQLYRDRFVIGVVGFCGLSSMVSGAVANFVTPVAGLGVAALLLILCLAGCWSAFPSGVTQVALYQVITTISSPAMGGALDYYYTATPECLADGPHFSFAYYITYTGTAGAIISLFGVGFYQVFLSRMRFRPVLLITTVLASLAGLSDLSIIMRWNESIGIPDKVAYMVGEAVLEPFIGQLGWIPVSALIALSVDPSMAASTFAFMAGISNFAYMFRELSGVIIFTGAGIVTSGTECNFDALALLVLLNHIVLPILIGVPAVFLISNISQDENLDEAEEEADEEDEDDVLTFDNEEDFNLI